MASERPAQHFPTTETVPANTSLWNIAEEELKRRGQDTHSVIAVDAEIKRIAALNHIAANRKLRAGQTLKLYDEPIPPIGAAHGKSDTSATAISDGKHHSVPNMQTSGERSREPKPLPHSASSASDEAHKTTGGETGYTITIPKQSHVRDGGNENPGSSMRAGSSDNTLFAQVIAAARNGTDGAGLGAAVGAALISAPAAHHKQNHA